MIEINYNLFKVFVVLLFLWRTSSSLELQYKQMLREMRTKEADAAEEEG